MQTTIALSAILMILAFGSSIILAAQFEVYACLLATWSLLVAVYAIVQAKRLKRRSSIVPVLIIVLDILLLIEILGARVRDWMG